MPHARHTLQLVEHVAAVVVADPQDADDLARVRRLLPAQRIVEPPRLDELPEASGVRDLDLRADLELPSPHFGQNTLAIVALAAGPSTASPSPLHPSIVGVSPRQPVPRTMPVPENLKAANELDGERATSVRQPASPSRNLQASGARPWLAR